MAIANSRGPASLADLAASTGATAITVKSSAVVIDTGNYYPSRDGAIAEIDGGLPESEWVARVLGIRVAKAFNNIVAPSLATRGAPAGTPGRICLSVAGDDAQSKTRVRELIDALGFDSIDAGVLADSWRQQPGTPAYCRDLDVHALRAALNQADAGQVTAYRAQADEAARPYFT